MSEIRYCRDCATDTRQDKKTELEKDFGPVGRFVFGVASLGATELINDRHWKCQRCGVERKD